jgi:hypothetical protein
MKQVVKFVHSAFDLITLVVWARLESPLIYAVLLEFAEYHFVKFKVSSIILFRI